MTIQFTKINEVFNVCLIKLPHPKVELAKIRIHFYDVYRVLFLMAWNLKIGKYTKNKLDKPINQVD